MRCSILNFFALMFLSAGFVAMGLLIAFWPALYSRWVSWSTVENYAPWLSRRLDVYSWKSRIVGIWMALGGVIFTILTVYVCWFQ